MLDHLLAYVHLPSEVAWQWWLYDRVEQIGGMTHVMLPRTDNYLRGDDPLKYADLD